MKFDGVQYKQNAGVIIDVEDDLPVVGQIEEIYVADNVKSFFKLNVYAKQKHLRCKKRRGQSEAAVI